MPWVAVDRWEGTHWAPASDPFEVADAFGLAPYWERGLRRGCVRVGTFAPAHALVRERVRRTAWGAHSERFRILWIQEEDARN